MSGTRARTAQVSLEFLSLMSFALLLLVVMLVISYRTLSTTATQATYDGMQDVAQSIRLELVTASALPDGYYRSYQLPVEIQKRYYTITNTIDGNSSVIVVQFAEHQVSVRAPACNGTFNPGTNTIAKLGGELLCNS